MSNPMMQQAMGMMTNPNAQAVPQAQPGTIDPTQHPIVGAIIKMLSQGMQNYSQTAMDPRERMQRQEMDAQKAEALGRMGIQQQQVGIEQQRANTEQQGVTQTGEYQRGELGESSKRTAIAGRQADTEKQRADQEYKNRSRELDTQEKKFAAEYGTGGLRSREVATQESSAKTAQGRLAAEQQMNKIIADRDAAEAKYHQDSLRAQGLLTDRTALEDERKSRYKVADDSLDKHFWFFDSKESLLDRKNQEHAKIDAAINPRIAEAERAAGTGAGAATPSASGVTHVWNGTGIQPVNPQKPR